ncbi:unnamed protein product, partial [marine sediment metagenome]
CPRCKKYPVRLYYVNGYLVKVTCPKCGIIERKCWGLI